MSAPSSGNVNRWPLRSRLDNAEEILGPVQSELTNSRTGLQGRQPNVSPLPQRAIDSVSLPIDIDLVPSQGPKAKFRSSNELTLDSYQSLPQSFDPAWLPSCGESSFMVFDPVPMADGRELVVADLPQPARTATPAIADRNLIRRPRRRLQHSAVHVLKTWYDDHVSHPYPSISEVADLMQHSGLSRDQVMNWLANKRRRHRQVSSANKNSHPRSRMAPGPSSHEWTPHHTPFERWRNSPPEDEPNDITLVQQAAAIQTFPLFTDYHGLSDDSDASTSMFILPSTTSSQTSQSSGPESDMASHVPMRGSKRRRTRRTNFNGIQERVVHRFQCTFCTASFKTKYDWSRHEKSLHLSLEAWVCSATEIQDSVTNEDGIQVCAYCSSVDTGREHMDAHSFAGCRTQDIETRTFVRKDHLVQHLRNMHGSNFAAAMQDWRTSNEESVVSRCGFCSENFSTWDQRVQHLAGHFRDGISMSSWEGDWGFEPHVQAQLEQAMPPYLIDWERSTMDPFVVEQAPDMFPWNDFAGLPNAESPDQMDPFLEAELGPMMGHHSAVEYTLYATEQTMESRLALHVQQQIQAGLPIPSDAELQDCARLIIYEDLDRMNTTFADSPQWLAAFRQRHGFV